MTLKQPFGLLFLCLIFCHNIEICSQSKVTSFLAIFVLDNENNTPLQDATISIKEQYYITDKDGVCNIPSNFNSNDSVTIQNFGYQTIKLTIKNIQHNQPFTIKLKFDTNELDEVIINANTNKTHENTISQKLDDKLIRQSLGMNLAESLQQIKGISSIKTGSTVAKPVIHGMHSNRVLIINNGARQQGQQWGTDHAPELDMNTASDITILKGAESVRYGSNALGGVIILNNRALPYQRRDLKGNLSSNYSSNGQQYNFSGFIDGSLSKNLAWRIQGTYIDGGDKSTGDYLLNNTGVKEKDISLAIGYQNNNYGGDVFYSQFNTKIGVLYSAQMGDIDLLKARITLGRPTETTPFSRKVDVPNQSVTHHLIRFNGFITTNRHGVFKLKYSYQIDHRDEFHNRRNNLSYKPSLSLRLKSIQSNLKWKYQYNNWNTEIGIQHNYTNNSNTPGTGIVPIIPNYIESNTGLFSIQKYKINNWSSEIGLRYDRQHTNALGIDAYSNHYGGKHHFNNLTYNLGSQYQFNKSLKITSNIGSAWRAPHVHELYSNGLDHASGIYAIGDSTLTSEKSIKWITALSFNNYKITSSIEGYLQKINNFIYDEPRKDEFMTIISGTYPVFRYKQTNAFFRGVNTDFNWKTSDHLTYNAISNMIWVNELSSKRFLPFIPSFNFKHSIQYQLKPFKHWNNTHIKLKHNFVDKQRRFDPQTDLITQSPPAYHLFGLELGSTLLQNNNKISILLNINNILNKLYKEYTNRFRYYAHDDGRDIKLTISWQF